MSLQHRVFIGILRATGRSTWPNILQHRWRLRTRLGRARLESCAALLSFTRQVPGAGHVATAAIPEPAYHDTQGRHGISRGDGAAVSGCGGAARATGARAHHQRGRGQEDSLHQVRAMRTLLSPQPIELTDGSDIGIDDFDHTILINLRAPFILCKAVVPAMQAERWGRVVTIGSISASGAGVNGCHYAASKGGVQSMMKNLATRLGKDGLTFNDVAPAMIADTGMIPDEKAIPGVREQIPVGRLGRPDEVGNIVAMLVKTGYCTGQSIMIAGGLPHQ